MHACIAGYQPVHIAFKDPNLQLGLLQASRPACYHHVFETGDEIGLESRLRKVPHTNPVFESQGNRKMTDGNREIFLIVAPKPKQPERQNKLFRGLHPANLLLTFLP